MNDIEKRIEKVWSRLGVKHQIKNGRLKWKKTLRTANCTLCPKHDREPRVDRGLPGWNVLMFIHDKDGKLPEVCPTCALRLTGASTPPPMTAECRTCHTTQKEKLFGLGWPGWQVLTSVTKPRAVTRTFSELNRNMICPDCTLNLCMKLGKNFVRETWTALTYDAGQLLTAAIMNQNQANFAALGETDANAPSPFDAISAAQWAWLGAIAVWTNWIPAYGASGAMTYGAVTTHSARYCQIGKVIYFYIRASGTTGGVASTDITFTLPSAPAAASTCFGGCAVGDVNDLAGSYVNDVVVQTVRVMKYDDSNWNLGIGKYINVAGFYEIA